MKHLLYILLFFVAFVPDVQGQDYKPDNLNVANKRFDVVAPVPYKNGIVFISNQVSPSALKIEDEEDRGFSNIYFAELKIDSVKGKVKLGRASLFSEALRTNFHDGPVTFTGDEQTICFVRAYVVELGVNGRRSNPNSGLYFAHMENGEWSNIEAYEHNNFDCSYYSPSLTKDGKILYFTSNQEGGFGGLDLYVSRLENGKWTQPENLGNKINTPEDEAFPSIHPKGRLYFSSKGHDTRGGADIFYAVKIQDEWKEPVKLPMPFNSLNDDKTLMLSDDYNVGFFTRKSRSGIAEIYRIESDFPVFSLPRESTKRKTFCYELKENSMDTIDYETFSYEWVINDSIKISGHCVRFCFPGPEHYDINFNVHNKLTDTTMYGVASMSVDLAYSEVARITSPDTVLVGEPVSFSAKDSYLPRYEIDGYYWNFNGEDRVKGIEAEYVFNTEGVKHVVLGLIERIPRKADYEPERFAVYKDIVVLSGD